MVLRNYPELAGTYATAIAMEKKLEADGLTAQQKAIVRERVRQNLVRGVELGHIADMKIKAIAIHRELDRGL